MIAGATELSSIAPGTAIHITLGRRSNRDVARPLDALDFRARLDLALAIRRDAGSLVLHNTPIAIDNTPLRLTGLVGDSLYRAARAAGAPPRAVEAYIKAIAGKASLDDLSADASYTLLIERKRAATGEVELGNLLFAGLDRGKDFAVHVHRMLCAAAFGKGRLHPGAQDLLHGHQHRREHFVM